MSTCNITVYQAASKAAVRTDGKPLSYTDRRRLVQVRTEPAYFKFTPEFKERLIAHSLTMGIPMVEVLERALDAMEQRDA